MTAGSYKDGVIISRSAIIAAGIETLILRNFDNINLNVFDEKLDGQVSITTNNDIIFYDLSDERQSDNVYYHYLESVHSGQRCQWVMLISADEQQYEKWHGLPNIHLIPLLVPESELVDLLHPLLDCMYSSGETDVDTDACGNVRATRGQYKLTASEKRVLRLLGRGLGVNQVANVLQKSNKTISAQKRSALRRLSLRSNADMYAWINSEAGKVELSTEF
ncbi:helix-turn-helix domain-containing protein [Mangrovibacter phragmitis]|uniref:helix-turn-helix domain-containing protein n=1 Tax=Mangrovibacter phragmitis TaxID=1691903 RepID=UPI0035187115